MYKLFLDKKNNEKHISEITFKDIQKLIKSEVHEGYYLDYKREYNINSPVPKVKKQAKLDLCDDICSFANNEGGWLIFGIEEDEDHNIQDAPIVKTKRLDYNQQISEVLKNGKVSPLPNFETKIIKVPSDNTKCYLLIHVLKGLFPPYVSNGKIKTRIGSSANPIDISDRKSLDFLYDRAKDIKNNIEEFCKREIYYPPTLQNIFIEKFERPMLNIYIKSNLEESLYEFVAIEEMAKKLCSASIFKDYYYSSKSIVLFNSDIDNSHVSTISGELCFDYSIKLHFPLPMYEKNKEEVIAKLPEKYRSFDFKNYNFINGLLLTDFLFDFFNLYNSIINENKLNISNSIISVVLEKSHNCVLVTDNTNFYEFVKEVGLRRCFTENSKINREFVGYFGKDNKINSYSLIHDLMIMQFGILHNDIVKYNLFTDEKKEDNVKQDV